VKQLWHSLGVKARVRYGWLSTNEGSFARLPRATATRSAASREILVDERDAEPEPRTCSRIETVTEPEINLHQPHSRPYLSDDDEPCPGRVASRVVLGTDFRTDIALFSLPLDAPFRVRPGNDETATALRTICEAIAKAACRTLEIESGEILAEYRPALTEAGAAGLEAEIFIYDTLAGGAGFSPQLVGRGQTLFEEGLRILSECPGKCDASCYRCLRSFRNKLDHRLLDRKLGEQLLRHVLTGGYAAYAPDRTKSSLDLLFDDLRRQLSGEFQFERSAARATAQGAAIIVPIVVTRRTTGRETWVTLSSPIAPDVPVQEPLRRLGGSRPAPIVCVDDLLVRRHLPQAAQSVRNSLK
jgi:Domain of unknown function (DUF1998)